VSYQGDTHSTKFILKRLLDDYRQVFIKTPVERGALLCDAIVWIVSTQTFATMEYGTWQQAPKFISVGIFG